MILDKIVRKKKIRVEAEKQAFSQDDMIKALDERGGTKAHTFAAALQGKGLSIIAEVKKASPSKGLICADFDPVCIAKEYELGGASAISVLTEEDFFLGNDDYLIEVKKEVGIPVLRKDFIYDTWQVYEAAYLGADAVLLITAMLSAKELKTLRLLAEELGMDALVEVHNDDELTTALASGAGIIGINNRNLHTFDVDIKTTQMLIGRMPEGIITVSESGIFTRDDMIYVENLGVDSVLIGESLMRSESIVQKLSELRG